MIVAARDGWHRRVWAAVPFKGPAGSKRRLSGLLDEAERARLSLVMLDDVLDALLAADGVERVLVLGPGGGELPSRDARRLTIVDELQEAAMGGGVDSLNAALRQAQTAAGDGGARALLIVPADLPLIAALDVTAILGAGATASVVIAPDRAADGTNALLLAPPAALTPSFGVASFARHRTLAGEAGLACGAIERPGLALDLDTPEDVAVLLASAPDCRAARLLRELGIPERLAGLEAAQARRTTI